MTIRPLHALLLSLAFRHKFWSLTAVPLRTLAEITEP
jgi:hypothetical protein